MDTLKKAQEINEYVVNLRRDFHRNPEPSFEEVRTSGIVAKELESMGVKVTRIGKTGVLGVLEGSAPGKVIALRADMDALSVTEETGLPFSSEIPGFMHACGHDAHTAMLLGAAKLLSGMKDQIKGTVKFMFQPAEEIAKGAKSMVKGGVLKNPDVDMVFGMHIWADVEAGKIGLQEGPMMASADTWNLTVKGKSAHGSSPWQGVDAVTCAVAIYQGFQTIISRVNDAREAIVINVGTFNGGERFNVIPGKTVMTGMNRTFCEHSRKNMPEWMEKIIKNTCSAYGCEYEFNYDFLCSPTINNHEATATAMASVVKLVGEKNIVTQDKMMGSEDFSEYSENVPGTIMFLGGGNKAKNCCYSHHSNHFDIDEETFPTGVASYVQVALDFLK